jgi:formylglycine-generating enzyme required for sulfatase activity
MARCVSPLNHWPGGLIVMIVAMCGLILSCGNSEVSAPIHDNPLDEQNPGFDGDPFKLQLSVSGSGVAISWTVPEPLSIHHFAVRRLVDDSIEFEMINSNQVGHSRGWTDEAVENGHTYSYQLLAYDSTGRQTDQSLLLPVRIDLNPVITLDGGATLAASDSVVVRILSTMATEMRISNQSGLSTHSWQPFEAEFSWVLAPDEGDCTVYCEVHYQTGETSAEVSDSIVKDLSPPLIENEMSSDIRFRRVVMDATATADLFHICPAESLSYRWLWGDGRTDEGVGLTQVSHFYPGPARWSLVLEVTDWVGWTASDTQTVAFENRLPSAPELLYPANGTENVPTEPVLVWNPAVDEEFDPLRYMVYVGEAEPLDLIARDLSDTTYLIPNTLTPGTTYLWRIEAIDVWGGTSSSVTRQFSTVVNGLPTIPDVIHPGDGTGSVSPMTRLEWTPSFDFEGGDVVYDVFFGEYNNHLLIFEGLVETSCQPGAYYNADSLMFSTNYSWHVVARDDAGNESPSPIWQFSTVTTNMARMGGVHVSEYVMGDDESYCGVGDIAASQEVLLTTDFYMNLYEVTNLEYLEFLEWYQEEGLIQIDARSVVELVSPYGETILNRMLEFQPIAYLAGKFSVAPYFENHPAVGVTWYGAALYCNWLSEREGLPPPYELTTWRCNGGDPYSAAGYRLPTSAEWEFAAQYPDGRLYPWGDDDPYITHGEYRANYAQHYGGPMPVGSFPSGMNAHGFYDMAGNVWEWCDDFLFCDAVDEIRINPIGTNPVKGKALRGGDWYTYNMSIRCAGRHALRPTTGHSTIGFRLVRSMNR